MGRVPVVEFDVESVEVLLAPLGDFGDELLRRLPRLLRRQHDRCAVSIVGADEVHFVALHALEPHPDVRLDVFHDVADVERAVRVGKGGGDEQPAGHADFQKPSFYRLAPRVGAQARAITVAMTTAAPTVAAMITFSRCPHGRCPGRSARSRDIDVAEMDLVETNSVVPSAPIWRIRRCVASCESNAREMPLVGEGTDATSSPDSPPGFCAIGAVAPWGTTGIGGRVAARTGPAPCWPVSICSLHSRRSFAKSAALW